MSTFSWTTHPNELKFLHDFDLPYILVSELQI